MLRQPLLEVKVVADWLDALVGPLPRREGAAHAWGGVLAGEAGTRCAYLNLRNFLRSLHGHLGLHTRPIPRTEQWLPLVEEALRALDIGFYVRE